MDKPITSLITITCPHCKQLHQFYFTPPIIQQVIPNPGLKPDVKIRLPWSKLTKAK